MDWLFDRSIVNYLFYFIRNLFFVYFLVIELACGEYGNDKISLMVRSMGNGECIQWLKDPTLIMKLEDLRKMYPLCNNLKESGALEASSQLNQLKILMKRGFLKSSRDSTLTHLRYVCFLWNSLFQVWATFEKKSFVSSRIGVNVFVALMLGCLFMKTGNEGSR